jgi:hypothetical protein
MSDALCRRGRVQQRCVHVTTESDLCYLKETDSCRQTWRGEDQLYCRWLRRLRERRHQPGRHRYARIGASSSCTVMLPVALIQIRLSACSSLCLSRSCHTDLVRHLTFTTGKACEAIVSYQLTRKHCRRMLAESGGCISD